jgi:hypothetical protein
LLCQAPCSTKLLALPLKLLALPFHWTGGGLADLILGW